KDTRFVHRFHRQIGLIVSFVMFTFITSGAFHLLVKLHNIEPEKKAYEQLINRKDLVISNLTLPVADSAVKKVSLINYFDKPYYQISTNKKEVLYFGTTDGKQLPDGDKQYAAYLSGYYRGDQAKSTNLKITQVRQFDNEYGFINKRLPVEKVEYPSGENWYIETTSSKLATKVAGIDRTEGFSFIFLHKYFGMSWAGKDIRDIVSMLAALGVLVVSLFGFASFIKNK
ncbi:MAG: hypothetical protein JWR05_26, partial [Mucilaginibacter sp.]|nr:hypothetical protein [Mucilaginibacter sp.]